MRMDLVIHGQVVLQRKFSCQIERKREEVSFSSKFTKKRKEKEDLRARSHSMCL